MKVNLIAIGNSHGVRLPKTVIEQAGLTSELELEVGNGQVILRRIGNPRQYWEQQAMACNAAGEDCLEEWETTTADFSGDWR